MRTPTIHRPRTEPRRSTPSESPLRHRVRQVLAIVCWPFFVLFAVLTMHVLAWMALTAALLRGGPATDDIPTYALVGAFVAVTAVLAWLLARFLASKRSVLIAIVLIVSMTAVGWTAWGVTSPDDALFYARAMAWGESGVQDYKVFPSRAIENGPDVFDFEEKLTPKDFETIEYRSGGDLERSDLEAFMEETGTTSFIVIKDDAIRYEGYFNGYDRDSIVTSFSMAKSITSAMVGIAIDEGLIGGVDDPMIEYIPELRGRGLDDITIRHLLKMSSGIEYVADDEAAILAQLFGWTDDSMSYYHPDLVGRILDVHPDGTRPDAYFNYNNHYPELLGLILHRVTGETPSRYLQERIWKPLGMEFDASWSLDSESHGFELMQAGVNGRAIDFAKFGRLFLHEGDWDGKRIISRSWVRESTSPDPTDRPFRSDEGWQEAGGYYKYLWWGMPNEDGTYSYSAAGHLGQRIHISPKDDTIVVRFGATDEGVDWDDTLARVVAKLR